MARALDERLGELPGVLVPVYIEACESCAACSDRIEVYSASECPSAVTAIPAVKSRYSRFDESVRVRPEPLVKRMGGRA